MKSLLQAMFMLATTTNAGPHAKEGVPYQAVVSWNYPGSLLFFSQSHAQLEEKKIAEQNALSGLDIMSIPPTIIVPIGKQLNVFVEQDEPPQKFGHFI